MKLLVAGSRSFSDIDYMQDCLSGLDLTLEPGEEIELVCGMAMGADSTAYKLWSDLGFPIIEMPADWSTHGRSAGYRRNAEMAAIADALVAFWDGQSRGTNHMIQTMQRLNKPVWIFKY